MSKPLVSVVVPAYNNAHYIDETIDSILAQTYAPLEVIIGDHSSTDSTWEMLQKYASDPRVRLLQVEAGGGAQRNWNAVTALATGTYLKLVCGDDLIRPDAVQRQVAALEANPSAGLAASRRDIVDAHGEPIIRGRGMPGMTGVVAGATALRATMRAGTNIFGEPACVMFRRELLPPGESWISENPYLIDVATYASVLAVSDVVVDEESLASFRVNDGQWSVRLANEQAEQVHAFHRALRAATPAWFSAADVAVGNAKATVLAWGRRLAYIVFARRMRKRA
jgi:glycosyltransferase involved in cell wall biosynthesis